jgi:hypothetical protein
MLFFREPDIAVLVAARHVEATFLGEGLILYIKLSSTGCRQESARFNTFGLL